MCSLRRGGLCAGQSTEGQSLLAHELTHVVQQGGGTRARRTQPQPARDPAQDRVQVRRPGAQEGRAKEAPHAGSQQRPSQDLRQRRGVRERIHESPATAHRLAKARGARDRVAHDARSLTKDTDVEQMTQSVREMLPEVANRGRRRLSTAERATGSGLAADRHPRRESPTQQKGHRSRAALQAGDSPDSSYITDDRCPNVGCLSAHRRGNALPARASHSTRRWLRSGSTRLVSTGT